MPMALTERERGLVTSLFDRLTGSLAEKHHRVDGSAKLTFPGGRSYAVEASTVLLRSAFSPWGKGYLHCASEVGFEALDSNEWLTLSFNDAAAVEVEIREVRARDGQCRCGFEVKS